MMTVKCVWQSTCSHKKQIQYLASQQTAPPDFKLTMQMALDACKLQDSISKLSYHVENLKKGGFDPTKNQRGRPQCTLDDPEEGTEHQHKKTRVATGVATGSARATGILDDNESKQSGISQEEEMTKEVQKRFGIPQLCRTRKQVH